MRPTPVGTAAVYGGGAFATALAMVLAGKKTNVTCWLIDKKEAADVQKARENVHYLKGVKLPPNIKFTSDMAETATGAEIVLFAVPTQFLRATIKKMLKLELIPNNVPLLLCCKGIELGTMKTPVDVLEAELPAKYHGNIAVLSGPSFAAEVAKGMFTSVGIFSKSIELARRVQCQMSAFDGSFRCYAGTDVYGAEIASAMKNVLAIACGICEGIGFRENARAAVISRGIAEITSVARKFGSDGTALSGLAGTGDLVLTCSSKLSRNFTVGFRLGKGETMKKIMSTTKAVAEGVPTAMALFHANKTLRCQIPICEQVYFVTHEGRPVTDALKQLLSLPLVDEVEQPKKLKAKL